MKRPTARYNLDIRAAAKENGVYLWEIAEKLDISEPTFNRKQDVCAVCPKGGRTPPTEANRRYLRKELPAAMKQNILTAIDQIKSEHDG